MNHDRTVGRGRGVGQPDWWCNIRLKPANQRVAPPDNDQSATRFGLIHRTSPSDIKADPAAELSASSHQSLTLASLFRCPGFSKLGQGLLRPAKDPAIVPRGRQGWGGSQEAPTGIRGPVRRSIEVGGSDWLRWDHTATPPNNRAPPDSSDGERIGENSASF